MRVVGVIGAACCFYTAINVFVNGVAPLSVYSGVCGVGFILLAIINIQNTSR